MRWYRTLDLLLQIDRRDIGLAAAGGAAPILLAEAVGVRVPAFRQLERETATTDAADQQALEVVAMAHVARAPAAARGDV
jgi:hypothetical protein